MKSVSVNWKNNQSKNFVDECELKITLDITDPQALVDAKPKANSSVYFSRIEKIVNDRDKAIQNYATLEQNFWCLDGSNYHLPKYSWLLPLQNIGSVGYISGVLSNTNGTFATNPMITLTFSRVFTTTIPAISILWDKSSEEYALDFNIKIYNGETIIADEKIIGNTKVESIVYVEFNDYDKITVEIKKWCKPFSRARITGIDLGILKEFSKKEIISMNISESVDVIGATLPTNHIQFELDNSDDFFNPYNADGFYKYLCRRQKVTSKIGYYNPSHNSIEWIQLGEYYLSNWNSPQNTIKASFEADNLATTFLNQKHIESNTTEKGISLHTIAQQILSSSKLPLSPDATVKWFLDNSLRDYKTTGVLPPCTKLEALQYIAQAACCVFYCDNVGNIHIEPINDKNTDYYINRFNSYQLPEIEVQRIIGRVNVNCYTNKSSSEKIELFNGTLNIEGDENVKIEFSTPTLDIDSLEINITGAKSFSSIEYNKGCSLFLYGCTGEVSIIILGKTIETSSRIVTIINDKNAEDEQYIDNPLITSFAQAKAVGAWVMDWLTKRNQVSTSWRCDPRINALDKISLENKFSNRHSARVTSVEMNYNGGIKGKLKGRLI